MRSKAAPSRCMRVCVCLTVVEVVRSAGEALRERPGGARDRGPRRCRDSEGCTAVSARLSGEVTVRSLGSGQKVMEDPRGLTAGGD